MLAKSSASAAARAASLVESSDGARVRAATSSRPVRQCRVRKATEQAKAVKIQSERKPGEPRGKGRRPLIGYDGKSFVTKFGRVIKEEPLKGGFKLPLRFEFLMGGVIPPSVFLNSGIGRFQVHLTKYQGRWYIDDGWREFAVARSVEFGDIVNITSTCDIAWDVDIIGNDGAPKKPQDP